jgi:hypothetical protein
MCWFAGCVSAQQKAAPSPSDASPTAGQQVRRAVGDFIFFPEFGPVPRIWHVFGPIAGFPYNYDEQDFKAGSIYVGKLEIFGILFRIKAVKFFVIIANA